MPSRIDPPAVFPDEDLGCAAGAGRSFAVGFGFEGEVAPDDGDVAEVLNLGAREFESKELAATGAKFDRALQHVRLVLPIFLAAAHHNRSGRKSCSCGSDAIASLRTGRSGDGVSGIAVGICGDR